MNHVFHDPPRPSLRKWIKLHQEYGHQSIIRLLEYDHLMKRCLHGKGLDFGGGKKSRYQYYLDQAGLISIESINIDPKMEPTYLITEKGAGFDKVPEETFDFVISLNTLEHVEDPLPALKQLHKSLKEDGLLCISVPFMFRIHGHPDDFMRCTPSWWANTLSRAGYQGISIYPLVLGRATTAGSLTGFPKLLGPYLGRHFAFGWDYFNSLAGRLYANPARLNNSIKSISIGWFIEANK
jgi:SAM-dependent methyltransferase